MRTCLIALAAVSMLAACGDPLRDVPRLADVSVSEGAGQAAALDGEEAASPRPDRRPRGGFLGLFAPRGTVDDAGSEADAGQSDMQTSKQASRIEPDAEDKAPRRGLLGFLRPDTGGGSGAPKSRAPDGNTRQAAMPAETVSDVAPRGGFLSGLFAGGQDSESTATPDYESAGPNVALPYGKVARLCGAPVERFGRKVDGYPARGRGYTLYDSARGTTAPRNFYLAGFDDGCARQFTAAFVMFGDPETYELIRFGPSGKNQPLSETDAAYDTLKSRVCNVGRNKPCGSRVSRLMGNTVFVNVYERYGSNPRWKTLLLHDGDLLAMDVKTSK